MSMSTRRVSLLAVVLASLLGSSVAISCNSPDFGWYTDIVGETPCDTYSKLRQICAPGVKVTTSHDLSKVGRRCLDTNTECCCNSISWQLSNLCENCVSFPLGELVLPEDFTDFYPAGCKPLLNNMLPPKVQDEVCSSGVKIDDFFFQETPNDWTDARGFWNTAVVAQRMTAYHIAHGNNTLTRCEAGVVPSGSSISAPPSASSSAQSSSSSSKSRSVLTSTSILSMPTSLPPQGSATTSSDTTISGSSPIPGSTGPEGTFGPRPTIQPVTGVASGGSTTPRSASTAAITQGNTSAALTHVVHPMMWPVLLLPLGCLALL
ncbi:hypothetical protein C8Q76DRAFT_725071 [Earliella scabrosa]|nr:hypothetical protein C8Q76DRAFT_725071 [Earliella scabrosa]